jgi:septum formation protein
MSMAVLTLASSSSTRQAMLSAAGVESMLRPVRLDEPALRAALVQEGAKPRDMADTLAEMKARKCADRYPAGLVLGCDQILEFQGTAWGKATTEHDAKHQLQKLRGQTHILWSAAVLYEDGAPIWRHVSTARLTMRRFSDAYIDAYLSRNWPDVSGSVGAYLIEKEGVRLFSAITGDHFTILGMPLIPLLGYLSDRGIITA